EQALGKARSDLTARQEETLGWQRRVNDAIAGTEEDADRTYDDLRHALRGSRDALSAALDDSASGASGVPQPGPDALADLQIDIDTTAPRKEREHVVAEAERLGALEAKLRSDRTSTLLIEIDTLNHERLGMLESLSPEKRGAITGFTAAGLDQATSELRQLTLILRFHKQVIVAFVVSLRHPSRTLIGRTLFGSVLTLLEWIAVIGGFFWWRRRSPILLSLWRKRVLEEDRHARLATPSFAGRALGFALQVHRPLEWLLLLLVLTWFLPAEVHAILEVKVALTIVTWTVGAAFVVDAINALAGAAKAHGVDIAKLRLRSLRLVARVVVVFGLILVISSMLVGHGTIYQWVFSTCWLASIPILLVLVKWWKNVVFLRLERVRKKSAFQQWVLANSKGWTSFVAATAGGVHLFVSGTVRGVRAWIGKFDVYRKVLAYLFRREMDKLVADREPVVAAHLPDDTFLSLGPETPSEAWIRTDLEDDLKKLSARIASRKGGIIVLVGGRGMGKTRTLKKLHDDAPDVVQIQTPSGGLDAFRRAFAERTGKNADATLEELVSAFDASPAPAFFVDDIHRLVQPVMGGLAAFDELLAIASAHSEHTTWVFSLDSVLWQFLERSRGARPLFDEIVRLRPWREAEIVELLAARTEQAGVTPRFDGLLERLPANADEIDRREALEKRASDYYRLLWDHGGGNPGVVLHVWRRSLGVGPEGTVCVKLFQALDSSDLERLPDHAVFVLRAILQLAPADPEDITKATMVRPAEVNDALRYGEARGYIAEQDGRYRVTWTWFRAVTLFLQRRHLLGS
ncbi:MAG: AAA family ATPase, partial [Polyangiaceae bacterium]